MHIKYWSNKFVKIWSCLPTRGVVVGLLALAAISPANSQDLDLTEAEKNLY